MAVLRRAFLVLLTASLPSCGGASPTGNDSGGMQSFSGTAVVGSAGGNTVFGASLDIREGGKIEVSVDWTVTAAGSGPNAGNRPPLLATLWRRDFSFTGSEVVVAQRQGQSPFQVSASVDKGDSLFMDVQWNGLCGGCTLQYTITIRYPPGVLRPDPSPSCRQWILVPTKVDGQSEWVYPELDLASSPAIARLGIGQKAYLTITGLECVGSNPGFEPVDFSADPAVAAMTPKVRGAVVTAVGRGETRPAAAIVTQDGASIDALLAYCSQWGPTNEWCAAATPMTLVVR